MKVVVNRVITALACFVLLAWPSMAFAAQQANSSASSHGYSGGFGLLIVYFTRKRAFGGWLLMYYLSIYSGLLFALALVAPFANNYNPRNWPNLTRYVVVMSNITIAHALLMSTAVVSTLLLLKKYRGQKVLSLLKQLLFFALVTSFASIGVDLIYQLWDSIALDAYGLVVSAIWYFYFVRSERVQHVFVLQDFKLWYAISRETKRAAG